MSTFHDIPANLHILSNELAFAIRDKFPVSTGHTLIVTKRLVKDWFDTTDEEKIAVFKLVSAVKENLDIEYQPMGYNIGINSGEIAGQTIAHVHVHVIPRYVGDVVDPVGGVRNVIPSKGNYLNINESNLVTPSNGRMRKEISRHLTHSDYDRIDFLIAFVMDSGVQVIRKEIEQALYQGSEIRLLTTDYLLTTDVRALGYFLDRLGTHPSGGNLSVKIYSNSGRSFHPKAYIFRSTSSSHGVAYVGSSNLSKSGLQHGIEWNLRSHELEELRTEFEKLWENEHCIDLTAEWLESYEMLKRAAEITRAADIGELISDEETEQAIEPWSVQQEALDALVKTRIDGFGAGLVVMATGLGKTWLAAFDSTRPRIKRVLFIAHRKEILLSARDVYRKIRPSGALTLYVDGVKDLSGDVVFGSINSISKDLDQIDPNTFDYIVVDEFHHADAASYKKTISHFRPAFMLGLTATPERTDGGDILALCDDNLVYECGLIEGLKRGLLSPFSYRAIKDVADYAQIPWRSGKFDNSALTLELATKDRADQVLAEWLLLGGPTRRTLAFCCSVKHSEFMAEFFRDNGYRAESVHSGPTSADRFQTMVEFEEGELPIVFSVDLFNEGIDIPSIDVVMMLRPTESPIVFLQQLGRGLRRSEGKDCLEVLDLVGNHRGFLQKAYILASLTSPKVMSNAGAVTLLENGLAELPDGCSIVVDLEVVDMLKGLLANQSKEIQAIAVIREWSESHEGARPSALDISLRLGTKLPTKQKSGGWFGLLNSIGELSTSEMEVRLLAGSLFEYVEFGNYTKCYKLVTFKSLIELGNVVGLSAVSEISIHSRWKIFSNPKLLSEVLATESAFVDAYRPTSLEWLNYWNANPISALTTQNDGGKPFFKVLDGGISLNLDIPIHLRDVFEAMFAEIVDYRLHRYLASKAAKLQAPWLKPFSDTELPIDASFRVEDIIGEPLTIAFSSSGGGLNKDYVEGLELILTRLSKLEMTISDCVLDAQSKEVNKLSKGDRRIVDIHKLPVVLETTKIVEIRKMLTSRMKSIGQIEGASGGNSRRAFRIELGNTGNLGRADLEAYLTSGKMQKSGDEGVASAV